MYASLARRCSRDAGHRMPAERSARAGQPLRVRPGPRAPHGRMCSARARRRLLRTRGEGRCAWVLVSIVPDRRAARRRLGRVRMGIQSRLRGVRGTRAVPPRERASVVRIAGRHLPAGHAKNGRLMRRAVSLASTSACGPPLPSESMGGLGLRPFASPFLSDRHFSG
jgi:hypothetical protein